MMDAVRVSVYVLMYGLMYGLITVLLRCTQEWEVIVMYGTAGPSIP